MNRFPKVPNSKPKSLRVAAVQMIFADSIAGNLEKVLDRLRREYVKAEKAGLFDELKVFLSGGARPVSHEEIAARHGIGVSAVGVAVHRLWRRYGELLRQEVARTVSVPQEVDQELRHLIAVLGR